MDPGSIYIYTSMYTLSTSGKLTQLTADSEMRSPLSLMGFNTSLMSPWCFSTTTTTTKVTCLNLFLLHSKTVPVWNK